MNSLSLFAFLCVISAHSITISANSAAYPPIPGVNAKEGCPLRGEGGDALTPLRREVYDNGKIFDISHRYAPELPVWESSEGLGQDFLWLTTSIKNGSRANNSEFKLGAHTGTHVDAPGHFYDNYYDAGFDVDSLDLKLLNGLALLVDTPRDKNITAEVMKSLNIPKGVRRVLFRTSNTDRRLMFKKEFDTSYVGFKEDGAKWLIQNTDIKLVGMNQDELMSLYYILCGYDLINSCKRQGIDYLSVAAYDHSVQSHLAFLESREIILVEGLKLDDVPAGVYSLSCLPLRLVHSEASPIRCILIT